jgi:hypothetical protein
MVGVLRPQPYTRSIVEPQPPARLLLLRNFQPFTTPDPLDPVLANHPSISLQQRRDPTVAVASILASQPNDGLGESIFVVALCRPVALRSAWLLHHPARMPLTHAMRITRMAYRTAPSFRA